MKYFALGAFTIPAMIGLLTIFHVFIDSKKHNDREITNRIARLELFWLAINKPGLFCEDMDWVCENVEESKKK